MRSEAIQLEEQRLSNVTEIGDYLAIHERHRIFPAVFEKRKHARVLDIAAGVGVVGKRIKEGYPTHLVCNDVCPKAISVMKKMGLRTVSFDIDDDKLSFPFDDGSLDAVIALATIEHLTNIDHFLKEIHRILSNGGCLYISAPNYSGITYLLPFLITGKTFHDPLDQESKYEFHAHVKYFTYRTLLEYVCQFGFTPQTVYLALPESSSRFQLLSRKSPVKAWGFRAVMNILYRLSPRWASEPVICLKKEANDNNLLPTVIIM